MNNINFKPRATTVRQFPYIIDINKSDQTTERISGESHSTDINQIVKDLGVTLYPEDRVKTFPNFDLMFGGHLLITRAPEINITDGRKKLLVRSFASNISELFSEKGIVVGIDDQVNFALSTAVTPNMEIIIVRVAVTTVVENQPINFSTTTKDDPNLDEGKSRVERAGVKGNTKLTYRVVRENGEEVSRALISKEKTSEPVPEIRYRGTKPVISVPCRYNSTVIAAAIKYSYSANSICNLMMYESMGRASVVNPNGHYGLFQYDPSAFESDAKAAGYSGADIFDPTAQIYAATWALTHGKSWRW